MGTMGKACVRIPATLASCEVNIVKSQLAEAFCCDLYWWNDKLRLKLKLLGILKHLSVMNCGYTCCCYAAPDIDVCQHVTSIHKIFHCSPGVLLDYAFTVCSGSLSKDFRIGDVQIYVSSWQRVLSLAEASFHVQIVVRKVCKPWQTMLCVEMLCQQALSLS